MTQPKNGADAPPGHMGGVSDIDGTIEELDMEWIDDDDDDEDEEDEVVTASGEFEAEGKLPPASGLKPFNFETLAEIMRAHDKVDSILREGRASLPVAFARHIARDKVSVKDGVVGGVAGVASAFLAGDPILFFVVAPAGFLLRNAWNTLRIRMRRDTIMKDDFRNLAASELPELSNAWDLTCYMFVRQVRGYNVRVEAVNRIRENRRKENAEELLRIADEWDRLLRRAHEQLHEVCEELQHQQRHLYSGRKEDLAELDDNLRNSDPLGYFDGVAMLHWLVIDEDRILISKVRKVYHADMEARQELRDMYERRRQAYKEIDDDLKGNEPIFDDLEREHGEAVRSILEEDEDDADR